MSAGVQVNPLCSCFESRDLLFEIEFFYDFASPYFNDCMLFNSCSRTLRGYIRCTLNYQMWPLLLLHLAYRMPNLSLLHHCF